jgi:hypothetical protein
MKRIRHVGVVLFLQALFFSTPCFPRQSADSPTNATQTQSDAPPAAGSVTLPAGTVISVRVADEIRSDRDHPGDVFVGSVDPSVMVDNHVVIPRGTEAHIQMVDAKKGGHFHGKAEVELELETLVLNGEGAQVDADTVEKKKGTLSTKATAEVKPGAAGAAEVAASVNPVGAVALGGIAAFKAAKVDIKKGNRIPFTLSAPFTFNPPPVPPPAPDDNKDKSKKKKH